MMRRRPQAVYRVIDEEELLGGDDLLLPLHAPEGRARWPMVVAALGAILIAALLLLARPASVPAERARPHRPPGADACGCPESSWVACRCRARLERHGHSDRCERRSIERAAAQTAPGSRRAAETAAAARRPADDGDAARPIGRSRRAAACRCEESLRTRAPSSGSSDEPGARDARARAAVVAARVACRGALAAVRRRARRRRRDGSRHGRAAARRGRSSRVAARGAGCRAAQWFALSFARAYLTWSADPTVSRAGARAVPDGGRWTRTPGSRPRRGPPSVSCGSAIADERDGAGGERDYTIAADTGAARPLPRRRRQRPPGAAPGGSRATPRWSPRRRSAARRRSTARPCRRSPTAAAVAVLDARAAELPRRLRRQPRRRPRARGAVGRERRPGAVAAKRRAPRRRAVRRRARDRGRGRQRGRRLHPRLRGLARRSCAGAGR